MRVLHAAVALAVLAGVTGPLSAQSLGDLAAQEKQKRQGKPAPKVITESELAKAGKQRGTVSFAGETPAEEASAEARRRRRRDRGRHGRGGRRRARCSPVLRPPARPRRRRSPKRRSGPSGGRNGRRPTTSAKEKVRVHQLNVSNIQKDLNDITGGIYTDRRNAVMKMLTDEQAALASAQAELDRLDAEGRSNGWPR